MLLSQEGNVLSGLPVDGVGGIQQTGLQELDREKIIKRLPFAENFVTELLHKQNSYISIIYEDIFGNHFATIHNGTGTEFSKAFEFKELK